MTPRLAWMTSTFDELIDGIDRGIESHLAWNNRLMRCSLLREAPNQNMLSAQAHEHCDLGQWLARVRSELTVFDQEATESICTAHEHMHTAVAHICARTLNGQPAIEADLTAYEQGQRQMVAQMHLLRQRVVDASMQHDVLTGLPLRHGVEHAFKQRQDEALQTHRALWVAMIDADRFKLVNDTYGHAVGDQALRHLATLLADSMREHDILFRFGGEEFLAMLLTPHTAGIEPAAQRLLETVRNSPLPPGESSTTLALTVTIGLACVRLGETLSSAIERADQALLQGKLQGRDCYVLALG